VSHLIPRRTFLKGVGTLLALPMLEAMLPLTALATSVKVRTNRMAFLFVPNGISMPQWTPPETGAGFQLPEVLSPLSPIKGQFSILSGLAQHNAFDLGDGPGDHARSAAAWLTGVHPRKTAGADIKNGISADQVAAGRLGHLTPFPSLEIGCERGAEAGNCDSGYSCAYSSNISWRSETTPVAKEINPRLVFERLFGNGEKGEALESRILRSRYNKSVLDFVMEDASQLKGQIGKRDQQKLDEYFTAVREIEERLAKFDRVTKTAGMTGIRVPSGVPQDYAEHIRLMGDMMILAFQADLTRVCTFMFANEGSNRSYPMVGVPEGHHDMSHHGTDPVKLKKKAQIDQFHVTQLAYVLEKMASIKEPEGSLLDNSMVVYGGGIGDGDRHNHDDLPILLAGGGAGSLKSGSHQVYASNTPLNNLFLSLLDRMGVPTETLGDSTGRLQQLF